MNKEDKRRILIHYLTRLIAKSMDMTDTQLDKYIDLIGKEADVRYEEYWDLNEAEKSLKKKEKKEGIRQCNCSV